MINKINKYKQKGFEEYKSRRWKRAYFRDLLKIYYLD